MEKKFTVGVGGGGVGVGGVREGRSGYSKNNFFTRLIRGLYDLQILEGATEALQMFFFFIYFSFQLHK